MYVILLLPLCDTGEKKNAIKSQFVVNKLLYLFNLPAFIIL